MTTTDTPDAATVVHLAIELALDPEVWQREYGVSADDVDQDVRTYYDTAALTESLASSFGPVARVRAARLVDVAPPHTTPVPTAVLDKMADLFEGDFVEVGGHCSCREADRIADFLYAAGRTRAAAHWLIGHASGDDDEDDVHRHIVPGWHSTGAGTGEHFTLAEAYLAERLASSD